MRIKSIYENTVKFKDVEDGIVFKINNKYYLKGFEKNNGKVAIAVDLCTGEKISVDDNVKVVMFRNAELVIGYKNENENIEKC